MDPLGDKGLAADRATHSAFFDFIRCYLPRGPSKLPRLPPPHPPPIAANLGRTKMDWLFCLSLSTPPAFYTLYRPDLRSLVAMRGLRNGPFLWEKGGQQQSS